MAIALSSQCSSLLLNSWYMDDGVLAGPSLVVNNALTIILIYIVELMHIPTSNEDMKTITHPLMIFYSSRQAGPGRAVVRPGGNRSFGGPIGPGNTSKRGGGGGGGPLAP